MQGNKPSIRREPAEAQAPPALRLYEVQHHACPRRLVQAWTPEEAKSKYREWYGLHSSRPVTASEAVSHANSS